MSHTEIVDILQDRLINKKRRKDNQHEQNISQKKQRLSNTNPTKDRGRTHVPRKGQHFLFLNVAPVVLLMQIKSDDTYNSIITQL